MPPFSGIGSLNAFWITGSKEKSESASAQKHMKALSWTLVYEGFQVLAEELGAFKSIDNYEQTALKKIYKLFSMSPSSHLLHNCYSLKYWLLLAMRKRQEHEVPWVVSDLLQVWVFLWFLSGWVFFKGIFHNIFSIIVGGFYPRSKHGKNCFTPNWKNKTKTKKPFKISYLQIFKYFLWIRSKDANLKLAPEASDETQLRSLISVNLLIEEKNWDLCLFPPPSKLKTGNFVHPFSDCTLCTNTWHLFGPEHRRLSGLGGNMDSMLSIKPVCILNDSLLCSIQKRLMRQISSLSAALCVCVPCWNHEKLQGRINKNWLKRTRSLFFFISAWKNMLIR